MGRILGSLEGRGLILVGEKRVGQADYQIIVSEDGGMKTAFGTITAEWKIIQEAFEGDKATIRLEGGGSVSFFVTDMRSDSAEIQISGPVPGY